eukprot:627670-Prymnesium_polylepis.1
MGHTARYALPEHGGAQAPHPTSPHALRQGPIISHRSECALRPSLLTPSPSHLCRPSPALHTSASHPHIRAIAPSRPAEPPAPRRLPACRT